MEKNESLHVMSNNRTSLVALNDASEGKVDSGGLHLPPGWDAVIPVRVGGRVHEQEASVSQLQLHRRDVAFARPAPGVSVFEDNVPGSSKRDGGDWAGGVQLPLVVPVFANVIVAIFIPEQQDLHQGWKHFTGRNVVL